MENYETLIEETTTFDLSYGQQSLFFLQQINPSDTSYNIGLAFKFYHPLDVAKFNEAIKRVIKMHPMLNVEFRSERDRVYQYVKDQVTYDCSIEDIVDWNEEDIFKKVNADLHTRYHLLKDNMLRVYLYRNKTYDLVMFVIHHIIADFYSVEILLNHFLKEYYMLENKSPLEGIEKENTYRHFIEDEKKFVASDKFEIKMDYWEKQLSVLDEGLDFNLEGEAEEEAKSKGGKVTFHLEDKVSQQINEFCEAHHLSPFIYFLTLYKLFLFQAYGKRDVIVGVPVSLRRKEKYKEIVGNFVNLLPVRMNTQEKSFIQDTKDVKSIFVDAMVHKKVPYSLMVEKVNPSRDKKNPIFQTTFNYLAKRLTGNELNMDQNLMTKQKMYHYELEAYPINQQLDQMDIGLEIIEHSRGFTGLFKFNKEVFNEMSIRTYAEQYQKLIKRVLEDPKDNIEKLRYADENERETLIRAGQNYKAFPTFPNVVAMIEKTAEENREAVAVYDKETTLTYGQLMNKVNVFANYLLKKGVKKGDSVLVYMNKQAEIIIAFIAIMKVGGVYIPVDISFPKNRIDYILESTASKYLVTTEDLREKEAFLQEAIGIDRVLEEMEAGEEEITAFVQPEDSAYIIFTSGSTGKPKGVEIQHKALINFLQSMEAILELKGKESVNIGGVTSISFDISILEFLLPLIVGGQTTLLTKDVIADPVAFDACIKESGVNIFQATPTTWKMILNTGWSGPHRMDVLVGGEMVPKDLANQLTSHYNNVWNVYGPTEATIWAMVKKLSVEDKQVSVGYPLHNMEAYLFDEKDQIVQKHVVGKLYLSGVGLAKGYYKRPDLTSERFRIIELEGTRKRVYDTGDLGLYLENGEVQVVGRDDDQVKLSGYRIELGEIESVLNRHDRIKNSAVLIKDQRLSGYMVMEDEKQTITLKELLSYCRQELPVYMVPSEFILVKEIPMTPNQKIDRKTLGKISEERLVSRVNTTDKGVGGLHKAMLEIWQEVLRNPYVSQEDNFFDSGGTSLLAMTLQQTVNHKLGLQITVLDIFTYPTIKTLCEAIENQAGESKETEKTARIKEGKDRLQQLRQRRRRI